MCAMSICTSDGVDVFEPVTWKQQCVDRTCPNCPEYCTVVPDQLANHQTTVALWCTRIDPLRNKKINNVHDVTMDIKSLAQKFDEELPKLIRHVYTAAKQWRACKLSRKSLLMCTLTSVEDYQQNLQVSHHEGTTSSNYAGNVCNLAMYPVCVSYQLPGDDTVRKGGFCFLANDMVTIYICLFACLSV